MWVAFALQNLKSYSHFFSKKFQHICVLLDVNFNESLTNDIVSFEQLGTEIVPSGMYLVKIQTSLLICAVWTESSSPGTFWIAKVLHADKTD